MTYRYLSIPLVLAVAGICVLSCRREPKTTVSAMSPHSRLHANDIQESTRLVASYVRYWERHKAWPQPGTYQSTNLIYKGTESGSITHPNRRRDFYRTQFDGGRELDVIMSDNGEIEVLVLAH